MKKSGLQPNFFFRVGSVFPRIDIHTVQGLSAVSYRILVARNDGGWTRLFDFDLTVEALQDENLEHHGAIERWASHFAPIGWLGEGYLKNRKKDSPVDVRLKLHQWIFQLGQAFQEKMFVEKAQWIDVLHGSRINGMATAVKYEKSPLFRYAIYHIYNNL